MLAMIVFQPILLFSMFEKHLLNVSVSISINCLGDITTAWGVRKSGMSPICLRAHVV